MVIRYDLPNLLVVTKGHPFDKPAFFALLDALPGAGATFGWTHVEHPAATAAFAPEAARRHQAFLFYDMPGIEFRTPAPPIFHPPPAAFMAGLEALLERGAPLIFLHHAIAGWPASERYAEIMGGRFLYQPARLRGEAKPDSGYRHDVRHHIRPVARHPVTAGLDDGFTLTDELYLFEAFEDQVTPLLRSDADFSAARFYSARLALEGRMHANDGWERPPGSNLIAWTRREKASGVTYIQCGDGPATYADPGFRTLLGNAVSWAMAGAPEPAPEPADQTEGAAR